MNIDQILQALLSIAQAQNQTAKNLTTVFPQQGGTSTSATAGSAALPSNPIGFLTVTLPNGTAVKVPYYG